MHALNADHEHVELRWILLACLPGIWLSLSMPVFAQEAYYWTYAQHPDCSYYDHPPMVAWLIWTGTQLLGDGAIGVRLLTMLCGLGTLLVGMHLLRAFGASANAVRAWLLFSSCAPVLIATRFLANPDPPLCLFWLASMAALWRARDGKLGWWILAGVFTGCALLSKYTAAFLGLSGVLVLLFDAPMRRQLRRPGPWLAVLTALLVFLPVVLWNIHNDFESFRFQTSHRFGNTRWSAHWFFQFVGGQFGLLHPAIALMLPFATLWLARRALSRTGERDPRALWLLAFGLPMPLFFLANAMWMQVKPNWIAPAYLPLMLGVAWWWSESGVQDRRPRLSLSARRAAICTMPLLALAPLISLWPQHRGSSWTGWTEIATCAEKWEEKIDPEDHTEGNVFFFAADYKDAAQLTHGLRLHEQAHPEEPRVEAVLAQNARGHSALQFDHWDAPQQHLGQDAIFVLPRASERAALVGEMRARFVSAEMVEQVHIDRFGIEVFSADIFVCRSYKGAH